MVKTSIINVKGNEIAITKVNNEDYICLTDMVKGEEGDDHIRNWMRNKNTIEFLGLWEQLHNPQFKGVEFDTFLNEAGYNRFNMTPKKWISSTNAIGIISKSGRNGGTYAHKDIAFEFGAWISASFKLYLIVEYQRLKEIETNQYNLEWNVKRILSKANYQLHTDAIKNCIIPQKKENVKDEWIYSDEADMLNLIMFGCTAKEWRDLNKERVKLGENIRDMASINELNILSNLESLNSILIKKGVSKKDRYTILSNTAQEQKTLLDKFDYLKSIKKVSDTTYIEKSRETKPDKLLNESLNSESNNKTQS
jgi:hypothetical protein